MRDNGEAISQEVLRKVAEWGRQSRLGGRWLRLGHRGLNLKTWPSPPGSLNSAGELFSKLQSPVSQKRTTPFKQHYISLYFITSIQKTYSIKPVRSPSDSVQHKRDINGQFEFFFGRMGLEQLGDIIGPRPLLRSVRKMMIYFRRRSEL